MGKRYDIIDDRLSRFLLRQPMYFVGTAPLAGDGHLNLSPKGMSGTFAVLGPTRVGYLDYIGSGVETIAHLRENGRIVVMFCAFDGKPNIVRLHGHGQVVPVADPAYPELRERFTAPDRKGDRSVIVIDVDRISDSCGFGIPLLDFRGERDIIDRSDARHTEQYFANYRAGHNAESIDGLPGLTP